MPILIPIGRLVGSLSNVGVFTPPIFGETNHVCGWFHFFVRRIGMTKPPVKLGLIGQKVCVKTLVILVNI